MSDKIHAMVDYLNVHGNLKGRFVTYPGGSKIEYSQDGVPVEITEKDLTNLATLRVQCIFSRRQLAFEEFQWQELLSTLIDASYIRNVKKAMKGGDACEGSDA